MRILSISAAVLALAFATAADATTYIANRAVGSGMLDLSITTDGTIGVIGIGNILAFDITVTQGAGSSNIKDGVDSAFNIGGFALSATASDLLFDFDLAPLRSGGTNFVLFQRISNSSFWGLQSGGGLFDAGGPAEGLRVSPPCCAVERRALSGSQIVASVASSGAVPEPATWAMMIGGFGMAGAVLRRRKVLTTA